MDYHETVWNNGAGAMKSSHSGADLGKGTTPQTVFLPFSLHLWDWGFFQHFKSHELLDFHEIIMLQ